MKSAFAGQMEQVQQIRKAYANVRAESKSEAPKIFTEIKVDGVDYAYAWARTFTPSWVMGLIFMAGIIALLPKILGKFGVYIDLSSLIKKKEKK